MLHQGGEPVGKVTPRQVDIFLTVTSKHGAGATEPHVRFDFTFVLELFENNLTK